jgi:DNA-binding response OmpR family regulator
LIIDDDVAFRQSLAKHLEHAGYLVHQASDGETGISAFGRDVTDVVVVDIFMPGQGGLQTIDRLRRGWPQAKIVAVMDVKGHALMLGADRFLEKPFEATTLVSLVAALLGRTDG